MSRLHDIIETLDTRPDLRAWLTEALDQIRQGEPIREALELDSASARAERDKYLRQAALIGPWATAWGAAVAISAHVQGKHGRSLTGPEKRLIDAAAYRCRLPKTRERIYSILIGGDDGRIQRAGVTDHGAGTTGVTDRAA